jgi:hypothetical protein
MRYHQRLWPWFVECVIEKDISRLVTDRRNQESRFEKRFGFRLSLELVEEEEEAWKAMIGDRNRTNEMSGAQCDHTIGNKSAIKRDLQPNRGPVINAVSGAQKESASLYSLPTCLIHLLYCNSYAKLTSKWESAVLNANVNVGQCGTGIERKTTDYSAFVIKLRSNARKPLNQGCHTIAYGREESAIL